MEHARSCLSIDGGLPCVTVRSAPAIVFSGPAQRSLTLWPARSPSRLATLSIESSDSFVASAAVSIATGWSEPVPGRELHPLKSSAFHGALLQQLWVSAGANLSTSTNSTNRCDAICSVVEAVLNRDVDRSGVTSRLARNYSYEQLRICREAHENWSTIGVNAERVRTG